MIYLASPYSDPDPGVEQMRYETVRDTALLLIRMKQLPVFSPIVYFHNVAAECNLPTDAKAYDRFNTQMQRRASKLYILTIEGWNTSIGVTKERSNAEDWFQPIKYITANGEAVKAQEHFKWLKL